MRHCSHSYGGAVSRDATRGARGHSRLTPLILAAVLLLTCATTFANAAANALAPVKRPEHWFILFTKKAEAALTTERPSDILSVGYRNLDLVRIKNIMQLRLGYLFRRWRVTFSVHRFGDVLPVRKNYQFVFIEDQFQGEDKALGHAGMIDKLNRFSNHHVRVWAGALLRGPISERWSSSGHVITEQHVGTALGTIIAHEIGHCFGLRHVVNEQPSDLVVIMVRGAHKYTFGVYMRPYWRFDTQLQLDALLLRR